MEFNTVKVDLSLAVTRVKYNINKLSRAKVMDCVLTG